MKMNCRSMLVAAHVGLCLPTLGCIAETPGKEAGDGEDVGKAELAWSLDAPQRGWVDIIARTCYGRVCFGPMRGDSVAEYRIEGWACLKPNATTSSLVLTVAQEGPSGTRVPLSIVAAQAVDRPDTVSYGACANINSGFNVWINSVPNLPKVFYVNYHALSPAVTLEGTNTQTGTDWN
jgi:hypothetical protein